MIKSLRRKYLLTTMGILTVVLAVVLVVLNVSYGQIGSRQSLFLMKSLAENEHMPDKTFPGGGFQLSGRGGGASNGSTVSISASQLYIVKLDEDSTVLSISSTSGSTDDDTLNRLIKTAAARSSSSGKVGSFSYYKESKSYGSILILLESRSDQNSSSRLLFTSFGVGILSLVVLFFVSLYLSRFVTRPAEDALNKQRQFISDASHELKTPLSVISVNANVVSSELGPNKNMAYIQSEAKRMDGLIRQLLELAHMDDSSHKLSKQRFDLSEALWQVLLPFESTAFERKIGYTLHIQEGCSYTGQCESIQQVVAILVDNALGHTAAGGQVTVTLEARGDKRIIEVYNTGSGISPEELPHIFERFYKCDKSRSQESGSYGLGLAIAQSIVTAHGGTIRAESEFGKWARFKVVLS